MIPHVPSIQANILSSSLSRRKFLGGIGIAAAIVATGKASAETTDGQKSSGSVTKSGATTAGGQFQSTYNKIAGPLGPVLCAFSDNDQIDLESTTKWVEWQVAAGIPLIWTTYGTSHYMTLTDDEIVALNRAVAGATKNRAVFIASTNYSWSIRKCIAFIEQMRAAGADAVKVQIDWSLNPTDTGIFSFYQSIANETSLPLFAYTKAVLPKKGMSNKLFERILGLPQFIGLKNDSGDFYEQCGYLRRVRKTGANMAVMTGGSLSSFLHGYDFGQRAFATGVGMLLPKVALEFWRAVAAGRRSEAVKWVEDVEEPLGELTESLSVIPWACHHATLKEYGLFKSDRMRFPLPTASVDDRQAIRRFIESPAWAQHRSP